MKFDGYGRTFGVLAKVCPSGSKPPEEAVRSRSDSTFPTPQ